jgi:hypothetical protein
MLTGDGGLTSVQDRSDLRVGEHCNHKQQLSEKDWQGSLLVN